MGGNPPAKRAETETSRHLDMNQAVASPSPTTNASHNNNDNNINNNNQPPLAIVEST